MENGTIWLKPKPTHIDEYFEDFLNYLKSSGNAYDTLYTESLRLLKERVALLVEARTGAPMYRQDKAQEVLTFNTRLCGAWLLAVKNTTMQERKLVLLTMINNLVCLCMQNTTTALNRSTFAYRSVPELIGMAMQLMTHDMPNVLTFSWNDIIGFSLDMFVVNFLKMRFATKSEACCEGKGLIAVKNAEIMLATYNKDVHEKKYMPKSTTHLLPEYGFDVSSTQDLQLKESKKDDVEAIEEFVDDILQAMKGCKKEVSAKRLLNYTEGELVPVEVTEVTPLRIAVKTIDSLSHISITEKKEEQEAIQPEFVKEYLNTLNVLQSHETNPMLRYRILSVIRILCTLIESEKDEKYCNYIAKYIKTLILFAKADSDEWNTIAVIDTPEDLKDEETVTNGADILKILSCFAKGYDATSDTLDPYIESENETLSKTASLVQSYNRLCGILENKTLRGIKKQILNQLSVVTDGDSTLELSNELEGIFGEEDDMKEFKTSFFEAPTNAKVQLQSYNIFRGICAMMNNRGGVLYLGVDDKGIPVGLKNDLDTLARKFGMSPTLDAYMIQINRQGEEWFGETYWKYVTLKPINEHNVVSIVVEPYPYDVVYLKDGTTYLRKNNSSAQITDESTIEDIRRRRQEALRKTDDKIIILKDAIQKKRRVRFVGYKSINSGTITNRIVEPFHIDDNEYVHCYEAEQDKVKIFRISRAEKIVMTDEPWKFKEKHKLLSIDPFHMSGEKKIDVRLRLKLQAMTALKEYYPGISRYIRQDGSDTWMLETFTYNLYPLMVFYLSHAQYVEIIDAKGLKEAVADYVKQYLHI